MSWVQIINNAAVPVVFLTLVTVALAGQVLSLRVISLSLLCAIPGGAYGAEGALLLFQSDAFGVALVGGIVVGVLVAWVGAILDSVFRDSSRAFAILASLGLLKILQGLLTVISGGGIKALTTDIALHPSVSSLFASPAWLPYGIFIAISTSVAQWWYLNYTQIGVAASAVGDDPWLAGLFGIPIDRVQVITQCLGGAVAGVAGVLMAIDSGLRPDLGFATGLKAFGVLIMANGRYVLLFPWIVALVVVEQVIGYFYGGQLQEAAGLICLSIAVLLASRLKSSGKWIASKSLGEASEA